MSLVAALLIGSSAFAFENTKVSGDAQLNYNTSDAASGYDKVQKQNGSLFEKDSSAADVAVHLNLTTDVFKNDLVAISSGAGVTALTTLGLENQLVSNVWGSSHTAKAGTGAGYAHALGGAKVENAAWMNEAWVAATAGKTTLKLGRMELDTPLAFSEKWSVETNTFDAIVALNTDIPDTTLVGAYVGNGNGNETFGQDLTSNVSHIVPNVNLSVGGIVNGDGKFGTFGTNGAYAVGAINNSWKPLTAQAWYYNLTSLATAYWLQADLDAGQLGVDGLTAGAQFTSTTVGSGDASKTAAVMVGYAMKDTFTAKLAYSLTGTAGALHGANTATSTGASKLYTEAWWNYGQVTQADTSAVNLTVESPVNGIVDLGLYITAIDHSSHAANANTSPYEATLTAGKSFGPLDATLAYIYYDADQTNVDASNTVQAYLTLNF